MARNRANSRYIAFLRGINVGDHRVQMYQLRDLFTGLKFANVSTFIASGHVTLEAPAVDAAAIETRIEAHLKLALGYDVDTFIRTPAELAAVAAFRPSASETLDRPGQTLHVAFLRHALGDEAGRRVLSLRTEMDDFLVLGRELYWLCRGKTTDSLVSWPTVAKAITVPSTVRNVTTVRKLAAKCPPA